MVCRRTELHSNNVAEKNVFLSAVYEKLIAVQPMACFLTHKLTFGLN